MADGMLPTPQRTARRRPRRKKHAPAEAAGPDHGPTIRLANGTVEIVQGADPDAPARTVRRAERVSHYKTAWRRGEMTGEEYIAASRYAETCEREAGGRDGNDGIPGGSDPWSRTPPLTAVQAAASLRAAHEVLGADGTALLRCYVRDNLTVEAIAFNRAKGMARKDEKKPKEKLLARYQEGRKVIAGRIKAALTRLAEHWQVARR